MSGAVTAGGAAEGLAVRLLRWWEGGGALMPVLLAAALLLYGLLLAHTWRRLQGAAAATPGWHRLIAALIAALPLLGLLGTVGGMVETFAALAERGESGGALAARSGGGIGVALTTTQYGMCLAIPALIWEWALRRGAAAEGA